MAFERGGGHFGKHRRGKLFFFINSRERAAPPPSEDTFPFKEKYYLLVFDLYPLIPISKFI